MVWAKSSWSYWVTSTSQLGLMVKLALSSFHTKSYQGFWQWSGQGTRQGKVGTREEDTVSPPAERDLRSALTFSLVPLAPVESARSLPARSTRLILLTCRQRRGCQPCGHSKPCPAQSQNLSQDDTALRAALQGHPCRICSGAGLISLQAGLKGTSCQISCPGVGPSRDHEPRISLGLISLLLQSSIRPHHLVPRLMEEHGSPFWIPVGSPSPSGPALTFSVVMSVSASCRFCVKMMLNTAWERLLVSFMLVAATVLQGE